MALNLPAAIEVKDLQKTHGLYIPEKIEGCEALYHGGERFRQVLDQFLIKRKIEERDASHYKLRKARSFYVPYAAGLLDWIAAAAFRDGVILTVEGGSPESAEYYESLVTDADGHGTPLDTLCVATLVKLMLHGRCYLFPDFENPYTIAAQPKTKNARIVVLDTKAIDDWETDDEGALRWARMHTIETLREEKKPWLKAQRERHVWTFFDDESITAFEAYRRSRDGNFEKPQANKIEYRAHGLGRCPAIDVKAPDNAWVMDRIFDVAIALFNREASLTWALDMSAYATLVLTIDNTQTNQIVMTELAALRLRPGETANYISPPGGIYEPLFKDADRLKNNLHEVVRSLGINAASVPQAGRLSGASVKAMREPLDVLLESFAQPVLECVARLLDAVREYRGDDDVELSLTIGETDEAGTDEEIDGDGAGEAARNEGDGGADRDSEAAGKLDGKDRKPAD